MTTNYNQDDLNRLLERCRDLIGWETFTAIADAPPRLSAFSVGLDAAVKANGHDPAQVTEAQIKGAVDVAFEIWPLQAQAIANAYFKDNEL
jgi:hypothetical protein